MRIKKPHDYKIYIAGYFQAGKTTLIHSLDKRAFSIDKPLKELYRGEKSTTTVGFDLGSILWCRPNMSSSGVITNIDDYNENTEEYKDWIINKIELKGGPGQLHFKPVREHVIKDSQGILFVIDSTDTSVIGKALTLLAESRVLLGYEIPIIIIANKQDLAEANTPEMISNIIGETTFGASAKENYGVKEAIISLLNRIIKGEQVQTEKIPEIQEV